MLLYHVLLNANVIACIKLQSLTIHVEAAYANTMFETEDLESFRNATILMQKLHTNSRNP